MTRQLVIRRPSSAAAAKAVRLDTRSSETLPRTWRRPAGRTRVYASDTSDPPDWFTPAVSMKRRRAGGGAGRNDRKARRGRKGAAVAVGAGPAPAGRRLTQAVRIRETHALLITPRMRFPDPSPPVRVALRRPAPTATAALTRTAEPPHALRALRTLRST